MKFDDILVQYLGEFGRYQKLQFFLVCIPTVFTAMHALSWTFTGAKVPFRCKLPAESPNVVSISHNSSRIGGDFHLSPAYKLWLFNEKGEVTNGCKRIQGLKIDATFHSVENFTNYAAGKQLEDCLDGYIFDRSEIAYTALEKWSIVCDRSWIKAFIQSMYYVGQFFGSICFGILADLFGRKKSFFAAIFLQVVCGSLMAYVPWWPLFALLRIGVGFAHPGIFLIAVVIGMELVGPSRRVMAGVLTGLFFSLGQIILALLAFSIRNYHHLQLAISLPALLFVLYWWIVPESARWLISQRRFDEADVILQKAARVNKRSLPENWRDLLDSEVKPENKVAGRKYTFIELFKTPRIRQRILITSLICWPAVSMVYYGLSMNPSFLGGNRYVTFMASAFFEIPALVIVMFTMNTIGRKLWTMGGFLLAAISLFMTIIIPEDYLILYIVMVVLGKMALCAVYAILYVFTPELFPTVIRSNAMGTCSMVARVGAVTASYISMWLVDYSKLAVVLIFGSMCFMAGGSVFLLPETTGQPQFDTIEEAERFGKRMPLLSFGWRKNANGDESGVELQDLSETKRQLLPDDKTVVA